MQKLKIQEKHGTNMEILDVWVILPCVPSLFPRNWPGAAAASQPSWRAG
jgi:hypothetical protein